MKKLLPIIALLLAAAGTTFAADEAEAPSCPPPPPVAEAPAYPPPPAITSTPVCAPEPGEPIYRMVTVKKRVWEEEAYIVNETKTEMVEELHSRPAKINSPRLARTVMPKNDATFVIHKKAPYDVAYMKKVKNTYTVPVMKTKKVSRVVEEDKIVPERRFFGR